MLKQNRLQRSGFHVSKAFKMQQLRTARLSSNLCCNSGIILEHNVLRLAAGQVTNIIPRVRVQKALLPE